MFGVGNNPSKITRIDSIHKNKVLVQQKNISITKKYKNTPYESICHHKIYVIAEDKNHIYATVRSHGFPKYNPLLKGLEIKKFSDLEIKKDVDSEIDNSNLSIRFSDSWPYGKFNEIENPFIVLHTDINGRVEYVSKDVIIALNKKNYKEAIH
jgi:hypothetical protein